MKLRTKKRIMMTVLTSIGAGLVSYYSNVGMMIGVFTMIWANNYAISELK